MAGRRSKPVKRGFGNTYQERSGRWAARYTGPDTLTYRAPRTFDTWEDANGWLAAERYLIDTDRWSSPAARLEAERRAEEDAHREAAERQNRTFAVYADQWIAGKTDLRASTRASYQTAIHRHLTPFFGDTALDQVTPRMVRDWYQSYGTRTPTARAHAYQVLVMIFEEAADPLGDAYVVRNPVRIKGGARAPQRREPEVLTLAELFALARAMPAHHYALTLLAGTSGLRIGETLALRRRDLDLARGVVMVRGSMTREAQGGNAIGAPKTSAGLRDVHIPAFVVDVLEDHITTYAAPGRDGLIFPARNGGVASHSLVYGNPSRTVRRTLKDGSVRLDQRAGYGFQAARVAIGRPTLLWHDLRRTAATIAAEGGATVKELQSRLGHTTPTMSLHYAQATRDRDAAIARRIEEQFALVEPGAAHHAGRHVPDTEEGNR